MCALKAEEVNLLHSLDTRSSWVKMTDCTHIYAPLHIFKDAKPPKREPAYHTIKEDVT